LLFYFASYTARRLVGISVGIGSNRRRKLLYTQIVMAMIEYRPGAQAENINNNKNLDHWFDSGCSAEFS
jgi:hypothetical protein